MQFPPCHSEPVRTPARESAFQRGKRIATAPSGLRNDGERALCSTSLSFNIKETPHDSGAVFPQVF